MAIVPACVEESDVSRYLATQSLTLTNQGKVRDTYAIPADWFSRDDLLLVVATDRISIFDFVLPALVPRKGEVLTALTHFWLTQILSSLPNHLFMSPNEPPLNAVVDIKKRLPELPIERCLVVRKVFIPPFEMIFRRHLGGSVYKNYLQTGAVAGQQLPPNLPKWVKLKDPLFTPSTKAEQGHDINITAQAYYDAMGSSARESVKMFAQAYRTAYQFAQTKGILILDTKFEGLDVIADEVLTPDSSRFTTVEDWQLAIAEGRDPIFYDKEPVRKWGRTVASGIDKLDPTNADHIVLVHSLTVPNQIIGQATNRYLDIFSRLTGQTLADYQGFAMGVE